MITNLPPRVRERIDHVRTFHRPGRRSLLQRVLRLPADCAMCGTRIDQCEQRKWADAVAEGRIKPGDWPVEIPRPRRATWWEV